MPDIAALLEGDLSSLPYTLDDMAGDVVGLMDALDIAAAHVMGVSMGGMIAQLVAINHPARTLTLCSIMSGTGSPGHILPDPETAAVLLQPPPRSREEAAEQALLERASRSLRHTSTSNSSPTRRRRPMTAATIPTPAFARSRRSVPRTSDRNGWPT